MTDKLYVGSMGWSYSHWPLYPGDMKPQDYLREYARSFNSVEVNSSFYRIPYKTSVQRWAKQTPEKFTFSVKIPRSISHSKALEFEQGKLDAFNESIMHLGAKQGPILIQFPPTLKKDHSLLEGFLDRLPDGHMYAVEFRHESWNSPDTVQTLKSRGRALVQVEQPWLPASREVTAGFVYIRLEGDRRRVNGEKGVVEVDRAEKTREWAHAIRGYLDSGLSVYAYFSKFYSGYPPEDIRRLRAELD